MNQPQYTFSNSEQSKDFRRNSPSSASVSSSVTGSSMLDQMKADLARLARRSLGNVEEGFRGMNDTKEVKQLRGQFDNTIKQINNEYSKTVLETGNILDKFGKKVNVQEQMMIDAVKDFKWRSKKDQQILNSIAGRKEDSAVYQKMGSAKYTVYTVIALIIIGLTMTHMDLNFTAYMSMALVLSAVFIFIMTYFYWKKSVYNTS
jgi:hypothetical protein